MSNRPPRLAAFSYVGFYRYSLTFCVAARREVFTNEPVVNSTLDQISIAASAWGFAILAYCFMPDHLHLVVEGQTNSADLVRFAKAAKQRTGFRYHQDTGDSLWQKGYFDHVLRDEQALIDVARYVFANPVRKGLCDEPREYPYSGSLVWSKEQLEELWSIEKSDWD
jgi:REP-associated tyrosine transposase